MNQPRRRSRKPNPQLRFTPTAWAKLLFLRDRGPTEVGAFGITDPDDLLCVRDLQLVKQQCTETFVSFDDLAVAEFFEDQVDQGRKPDQFGRIWIHTHPDLSACPSHTDVQTFQRSFGRCDWAVMFILARGGQTYAELASHQGIPVSVEMNFEVDFSQPFTGSDHAAWAAEYDRCVELRDWFDPRLLDTVDEWQHLTPLGQGFADPFDPEGLFDPEEDASPGDRDLREPVPF